MFISDTKYVGAIANFSHLDVSKNTPDQVKPGFVSVALPNQSSPAHPYSYF